jgi:hypothetical protein
MMGKVAKKPPGGYEVRGGRLTEIVFAPRRTGMQVVNERV